MLNCDRIDKKSPGYSLNRAEGMHPTNSDQRVEYRYLDVTFSLFQYYIT